MTKKIERLITTTLLAVTLYCTTACKGQKSGSNTSLPPLSIECAEAYSTPIRDKITFATSLQPQYSVTIEPRISGYLSSIMYSGGSYIKKGDRLFRIDPSQINTTLYSAKATLESAMAQLTEAKNNYERAIPLSKIDAISQSTLDAYTANYAAAKAEVKSAQEQLRSAELNLSYTYINAPISGTIAKSPASIGDFVGVGTKFPTLTTINSTDTLEVELPIPTATYLNYVDINAKPDNRDLLTNITLILPDSTAYPYLGSYAYTKSNDANSNSTVVIVAKIANPLGLLKPNMFARVSSDIGEEQSRTVIPGRAVMQLQGINSVWIIKPDSTATLRRIKLGASNGTMWQVSDGVKSGEIVATTGQLKLRDGAKVNYKVTK